MWVTCSGVVLLTVIELHDLGLGVPLISLVWTRHFRNNHHPVVPVLMRLQR
jgi:hypothetical protein